MEENSRLYPIFIKILSSKGIAPFEKATQFRNLLKDELGNDYNNFLPIVLGIIHIIEDKSLSNYAVVKSEPPFTYKKRLNTKLKKELKMNDEAVAEIVEHWLFLVKQILEYSDTSAPISNVPASFPKALPENDLWTITESSIAPPRDLTVMDEYNDNFVRGNRLSWQPSPSMGVKYIVRRKYGSPISHYTDGEHLAFTDKCEYFDSKLQDGLIPYYAVYACRDKLMEVKGTTASGKMRKTSVSNLKVTILEQRKVEVSFVPPLSADKVITVKTYGREAHSYSGHGIKIIDSRPVNQHGGDVKVYDELDAKTDIYYTVFCLFKDKKAPGFVPGPKEFVRLIN